MNILEREIIWIKAKKSDIERNALLKRFNLYSVGLKFNVDNITIRVYTNESNFIEKAKTNYCLSDEDTANELIVLAGVSKNDISIAKIDLSQVEINHIGYYDMEKQYALATCNTYGLFKRLIIGFVSAIAQEKGYHPAHAGFIDFNKQGIMLIGGHEAGKTTSLMHMMQFFKKYSPKILTDDWVLVNENNGYAYALEDKISFTRDYCLEFPYLNITSLYDKNAELGIKKVYLHPNEIYGNNSKVIRSIINKIVLLEPANRFDIIQYPTRKTIVENILNGTYQMPDCNHSINQKHEEFWMDLLSKIKYLSFDTRHKQPLNKSFARLWEELK